MSVHQSVCPHQGGYLSQVQPGGTRARSSQGGGVPKPGPAREVPHLRYPLPVRPGLGDMPARGGTPIRPGQGTRGTPPQLPPVRPGWGVPLLRGTPPWVPPHQTWPGGVLLPGGTPSQIPPPPIRPNWGYPCWGLPHLGYPPSDLAKGYPCWGGTPPRLTDGVLDTPRSVCLLRSRRRTFLYCFVYFCSYF